MPICSKIAFKDPKIIYSETGIGLIGQELRKSVASFPISFRKYHDSPDNRVKSMNVMKSSFLWCIAGLVLIILNSTGFALCADKTSPPFDVDQVLNSLQHSPLDMWMDKVVDTWITKIEVMPAPGLPQHHYAVNVLAWVWQRNEQHDLHFIMKVAREGDKWDPGYDYELVLAREGIAQQVTGRERYEYSAGVLLSPGRYTIAIITYDPVRKKGNVVTKQIKLPRLKSNSLQEFKDKPPDVIFNNGSGPMHNLDWPLQEGSYLTVKNRRPLCIDIVVNVSSDKVSYPNDIYFSDYSPHPASLPEYSTFFSHLKLSSGSIRVSILDALRMTTFADRENAIGYNWGRTIKNVSEQDSDTVDASALDPKKASGYLVDQVQKVLNDAGGHVAGSPLRIVIIVSRKMPFPEIQKIVIPQNSASTQFFYFQEDLHRRAAHYEIVRPPVLSTPAFVGETQKNVSLNDNLYQMLKSTNLKRFVVSDRSSFLKSLSVLISEIEKLR
jgi:hypothetical protein